MGGRSARTRGILIGLLLLLPLLAQAQSRDLPRGIEDLLGVRPEEPGERGLEAPGASQAWEQPLDPREYQVGPGDRLGLLLYNTTRTQRSLSVGSDGWLTLPPMGRFDARGHNLVELEKALEPLMAEVFEADSLDLWLERPRRIKVYASGAIQRPAVLALEFPARLSEVLSRVRLVTPLPDQPPVSRRNLLLLRQEDSLRFDMLRFFHSGDLSQNPLLQGGDRVVIPFAGPEVYVDGPFGQPLEVVEFRQGDTPATLLAALGGLQPGTEGGTFELHRQDLLGNPVQSWTFRMEDTAMHELRIAPGDQFSYRHDAGDIFISRVRVEGEVLHPGSYAIEAGVTTLGWLLEQAGPHAKRADLGAIRIYREHLHDPELAYVRSEEAALIGLDPIETSYLKSRVTGSGGRISIYYDSALQDMESLVLEDGDQVLVTRRSEDVELVGAVGNQGRMVHRDDWSIRDYLDAVGGKIRGAQTSRIRVRTRDSDQFVPVRSSYRPSPGDVIFVPYEEPLTAYEIFKESLTIATQILTIVLVTQGL